MLENISLNNSQLITPYQLHNNAKLKLKSFDRDSVHFGSKQIISTANGEKPNKKLTREIILKQRNKNLPITTDSIAKARNELIKEARNGNQEALNSDIIKDLIERTRSKLYDGKPAKYNFWDYPKFYRFVSLGEIKNLLKGYIICPYGRYFDDCVDVTNNPDGWSGNYRITFKLKDNLDPLLYSDPNLDIPSIEVKTTDGMLNAKHYLHGGYKIDDVECIEKRLTTENGYGEWERIEIPPILKSKNIIKNLFDKLNGIKQLKK